jgi:hypothetical protein
MEKIPAAKFYGVSLLECWQRVNSFRYEVMLTFCGSAAAWSAKRLRRYSG